MIRYATHSIKIWCTEYAKTICYLPSSAIYSGIAEARYRRMWRGPVAAAARDGREKVHAWALLLLTNKKML
jgi:hypothetical protein